LAQVRDDTVDPFGSRQSATICPDRSLYWRKGGRCGRPRPFATDQGSGSCNLRSDSGRNFLRHHASALRIGRSTASGYADQAHCDYLLSFKPDLPRIGPKLPRSMHFASPNNEGRAGACFDEVNRGALLWFQVSITGWTANARPSPLV
jgi:hypothetical protein